ncbi:hypothetical protein FIE12Z_10652 [Fusarium flagelliforme]|uniref:Uncharacterized protein n=1 Tax=Fusarium flagelliforme TaxID=2675880 RepID=A0A395MB66_9HYPO|nr:hypothetical protein FIE12Z_10652 [Fusarium flagelliforme]
MPLTEATVEDHLATSFDHFTLSLAFSDIRATPIQPVKIRQKHLDGPHGKADVRFPDGRRSAPTPRPVDKVNFIRSYAKAREAGMRKKIILSGWRFNGNWPINHRKALAHPEIQPDKEKVLDGFKTPSSPHLDSDDTPETSRQMKVAIQNARITGLEEQVSQLRRGKKRKAVPNPNRRFMALAEALAAGESLPNSKEGEIEVDVDEEIESVIEVGVRSEDESEDFMALTKHCQRTRSGQEVKKSRRE